MKTDYSWIDDKIMKHISETYALFALREKGLICSSGYRKSDPLD